MSEVPQTFTEFIIAEQRRVPGATGVLTALVNDIRICCKRIGYLVGKGALDDGHGKSGAVNVQEEDQAKLDVLANDVFVSITERGGSLAALVSEEMEEMHATPEGLERGRYLLAFDPLDGSSNIDVNSPVGSIFSVHALPRARPRPIRARSSSPEAGRSVPATRCTARPR